MSKPGISEGPPSSQEQRQTPFSELLRRAMSARLTGRLELKEGRLRRRMTFIEGLPVRARSNLVREHLLRFLLRNEAIDQSSYRRFLTEVYDGRWERGASMVHSGVLTSIDLREAEVGLAEEIVMACFGWTRTTFRFHALPAGHDDLKDPLPLDPFALYVRWLGEEVSTRRIQRQIDRLHDRRMRLAVLGIEHREMLHRLLNDSPLLQQGIAERWQVFEMLDKLEEKAEPTSRVLLALYHLGAIELIRPGLDVEAPAGSHDEEIDFEEIDQVYSLPGDDNSTGGGGQRERDLDTLRRLVEAEGRRVGIAETPCEVLGVSEGSVPSEIREAFERLEQFYRPEMFRDLQDPNLLARIEDIRSQSMTAYHSLIDCPDEYVPIDSGEWAPPNSVDIDSDVHKLARILFEDGLVYLKLGDHEESLEHFGQANRRHPDNPAYGAHLGWTMYLCASDADPDIREQGMRLLLGASRAAPDDDSIYVLLGHVYCRNGQSRRGSEMYRRALEINPENADANKSLEPFRESSGF